MGWASYNEDIVSRWIGSRNSQRAGADKHTLGPVRHPNLAPALKVRGKQDASQGEKQAPAKAETRKLKDFVVAEPRPLPVIILADVSGSMAQNGKIDALNEALANMLRIFAEEDTVRADIRLAVITFGAEGAKVHIPLSPPTGVTWSSLKAAGKTPLGEALILATSMIEDRDAIPSRAYRPTIVLISDGQPTDDWEAPLRRLLSSPRASKATRFAMAIGDDADHNVLTVFLDNPTGQVFQASDARRINQFFCFVTMSVAGRAHSVNPNADVPISPEDLDAFSF